MEEENKPVVPEVPGLLVLPTSLPSGQSELGRKPDSQVAAETRENDQAWYQTLGIATDENTETFWGGVKDNFWHGGNFAVNLYDRLATETNSIPDPNFDSKPLFEMDKKVVPPEYWTQLQLANSAGQYATIKQTIADNMDARKRLERLGVVGGLASGLIAGFFDIDTPLALATGFVGKAGLLSTRLGRGVTAGGVAATAAAIGTEASFTPEWGDVGMAALFGMGLGSIGGGGQMSRIDAEADKHLKGMIDGVDDALLGSTGKDAKIDLDDTPIAPVFHKPQPVEAPEPIAPKEGETAPEVRNPKVIDMSEVSAETIVSDKGSMGARNLMQEDAGFETTQRMKDIQRESQEYLRATGIEQEYIYDYAPAQQKGAVLDAAARGWRRFSDTLQASGLTNDFDKLMGTGSATAMRIAHATGIHPAGLINNRRAAARVMEHYQNKLFSAWKPEYNNAFSDYAANAGQNRMHTWYGGGDVKKQFDRGVISELEARRLGDTQTTDPYIKRAADAIDVWSKNDIQIGKGRSGEISIKGYEDLAEQSGYFPRRINGRGIVAFIRNSDGKYTEKDVQLAFAEFYADGGRNMDMATAKKVAASVLARAKAQDAGASTTLWGMLQGDGRTFLEQQLKKDGMSPSRIDSVIERLTGAMEDRGKQGHTKGRLEGDMRYQASNGISIMDLIDTDVEGALTNRTRQTAGRASLARTGLDSPAAIEEMKQAILTEQQGSTQKLTKWKDDKKGAINDWIDKDRHIDKAWLDDYFNYFTGGIENKQMYNRIRKLTQLATMHQFGLTQAAEFGAVMAGVGFQEFMKHLPASIKSDFLKKDSPLTQELHALSVFQREEALHNPRYYSDFNRFKESDEMLGQHADNLLGAGQRLQGVVSGFNKIRGMQQYIAVMGTTNKLFGMLKDGSYVDNLDRLKGMGIDNKMVNDLKKHLDDVEWDGNNVSKLNMKKWSPELQEDFSMAINAGTNNMVQKTLAGETSRFMHRDGVMSLFWQLKSFPMAAIQKQFGRSVYQGDTESMLLASYGLLTAGMAMGAKQVVNGNYENLDPVFIGKLAFNMSNTFGWIPMFTDPAAQMLGLDAKLSPYSYGRDNSVISAPVALSAVNRLLNIPSAVKSAATGDLSGADISALKAFPVFGQIYGMNMVYKAMKGD